MPENASTEIRALLLDGRMYERKPDGTLVPLEDRSDWTRVDAMTDEELTANAESDPDSRPYTDEEWATAAFVHPPDKVPVGLKLDTGPRLVQVPRPRLSDPHQRGAAPVHGGAAKGQELKLRLAEKDAHHASAAVMPEPIPKSSLGTGMTQGMAPVGEARAPLPFVR